MTRRCDDTSWQDAGEFLCIKGGPEPLEKQINEILGSKREDRFSNPFFELVQNTTLVRFTYLLRLCNFCKGPRDMRKFPQKCQKIAGCWGRAVYVHNLRSLRHLAHPLWNDRVQTISWVNHGLTQRAPVPPLEVLTSALSRSFCWKRQDKVLEAVLQGNVASKHGWQVILSGPGRSGGDEPGVETIGCCVHKQRALNTRLSSGTSAGTFAVSAGPYRNYQAKAGTKNEPDTFLLLVQTKGWKIDSHVSNLRSREFLFRGVLVLPQNICFLWEVSKQNRPKNPETLFPTRY